MESHAGDNARNDGTGIVACDFRDACIHAINNGSRNIRCTQTRAGTDTDTYSGPCFCAERAIRNGCRRKPQQVLGATDARPEFANRRARVRANARVGIARERHRCDATIRAATISSRRNTERDDFTGIVADTNSEVAGRRDRCEFGVAAVALDSGSGRFCFGESADQPPRRTDAGSRRDIGSSAVTAAIHAIRCDRQPGSIASDRRDDDADFRAHRPVWRRKNRRSGNETGGTRIRQRRLMR